MTKPGGSSNPLRVAIIGSGPAGFYAAAHLFKASDGAVEVDMFDRLPTPFGLVRFGVAPDHLKIKSVTKVYERTAARPELRFWGNVEFGKHVTLDDLRAHYHCVLFSSGSQSDRKMGIPGEDLARSHAATEFVAWYNGHPDFSERTFDLSVERVAVIGIGNVAVDVARILCRAEQELLESDIADYALAALSKSNIKEVVMLGRRGPAQAAFTNPEAKELGELADADFCVLPEEAALDALSQADLESGGDKSVARKVELLQETSRRIPNGKPKRLTIRFLASPVELLADETGGVARMRMVKNELYRTENGTLRPRPTDRFEEMPIGLLFRSVGYRGLPLPGVPFNDDWGVILNEKGRIVDPESGDALPGLYTSGWIKRGPSGVIGTNKADSVETVNCLLQDVAAGRMITPANPGAAAAEELVRARQPAVFTFEDWKRVDALELERGAKAGRPRVKFTSRREMAAVLGRD